MLSFSKNLKILTFAKFSNLKMLSYFKTSFSSLRTSNLFLVSQSWSIIITERCSGDSGKTSSHHWVERKPNDSLFSLVFVRFTKEPKSLTAGQERLLKESLIGFSPQRVEQMESKWRHTEVSCAKSELSHRNLSFLFDQHKLRVASIRWEKHVIHSRL